MTDGTDVASAVLAEKDANNAVAAVYTPGISEYRNGQSRWFMLDALGSTRGLLNSASTVTDTFDQDAFGIQTGRTGTTDTPFRYRGKDQYQTDGDSGFMLLGHRYYDSTVGRFLTEDPAQDDLNWYAYGANNPLLNKDPDGQRAITGNDRAALHKISWSSAPPKQVNAAVRAVKGAIMAVPSGQPDPPNLKATLWALDKVGDTSVYAQGLAFSNGLTTIIPAGAYKCNIFVGDSYAIGAGVGYGGSGYPVNQRLWRSYPPVANALGSDHGIANLLKMDPHAATVGDITSLPRSGMGHAMLYLGGGDMYVYAGAWGAKVDSLQYLQLHDFAGIQPVYRAFVPLR